MSSHVEVFTLIPEAGPSVEQMLADGPVNLDLLKRSYFLCDRIPASEAADDPGETVAWCMRISRTTEWRVRQMHPLGHMDMVDMAGTPYMIYDTAMARKSRLAHASIPGTDNYVTVRINTQ